MVFLISLIIIILMHEAGHLIVAKLCKCGVDVFSLGFGRPIFQKRIGKTTYQIAWFLLGGYCKLTDELTYSRKKYAFTNLPYRKKLLISFAGVGINILLGILAMILGIYLDNFNLLYAGTISLALGITNIIPFPALDGSYPFLVLLEKPFGKKRGYAIMNKICTWGFIILMALNIACLPLLIHYIAIGRII